MEKPEKVAACYCRTSSRVVTRSEDSIEGQKKKLAELAASRNLTPVFFIDRCATGKHQVALRKMIVGVKVGWVAAVLVSSYDRISRSLTDFTKFHLLLKKHQVSLVSLDESASLSKREKIRKGLMRYQYKMLLCQMIKNSNIPFEEIHECLSKTA